MNNQSNDTVIYIPGQGIAEDYLAIYDLKKCSSGHQSVSALGTICERGHFWFNCRECKTTQVVPKSKFVAFK